MCGVQILISVFGKELPFLYDLLCYDCIILNECTVTYWFECETLTRAPHDSV